MAANRLDRRTDPPSTEDSRERFGDEEADRDALLAERRGRGEPWPACCCSCCFSWLLPLDERRAGAEMAAMVAAALAAARRGERLRGDWLLRDGLGERGSSPSDVLDDRRGERLRGERRRGEVRRFS